MSRILAALTLGLASVFTVGVTLPGAVHAEGPYSYAVGEATRGGHVSFSAHDGPSGPSGYVVDNFGNGIQYQGQPLYVQGPVTCLSVVGNSAAITFEIKKSNVPETVGLGLTLFVTDNHETRQHPYYSNSGFILPPQLRTCMAQTLPYPARGEIKVYDASQ